MHLTIAEGIGIGLGFLAIVAPEFWPKMPRSLSYTLAGIGLSWLTYSFILAIEDGTGMKLQHGPLAVIIFGAACIAGGIFWHISRLEPAKEQRQKAAAEAPPARGADAGGN